jgi:hypothetical protein
MKQTDKTLDIWLFQPLVLAKPSDKNIPIHGHERASLKN